MPRARPLTNWSGTHVFRARAVHRPSSLDEVRRVVAGARRLRVLGSRHSFSDIADADEILLLDGLRRDVAVDAAAGTATCAGATTYAELAAALDAAGVALPALASLPHISVAGAAATATHGSGDAAGNLATAVAALTLVTSGGDVLTVRRGDPDFDGVVVGVGALGAVVAVTLDVEPAYAVRQRVHERLPWEALLERFDEVAGAGDSVSVFTRFGHAVDQVWVKERVHPGGEPSPAAAVLAGATPAPADRHPIPGMDPVNCTAQLGRPGPWWDRLPHFRPGFTPSSGAELQSEYLVARADAPAAIAAVRALAPLVRPLLQVSEIRTVAADALWLSPEHGRETAGIHFTWLPRADEVARALVAVEDALAPFAARPHWGKLFLAPAGAVAPLYRRMDDFARLVERLDPRGAFRNRWLERHVLGG